MSYDSERSIKIIYKESIKELSFTDVIIGIYLLLLALIVDNYKNS
ncbi:MAG: hypothetical protein ACTTNT_02795 [Arsenophonus sp.]